MSLFTFWVLIAGLFIFTALLLVIPPLYNKYKKKGDEPIGKLIVTIDPVENEPYVFLEMHENIDYILKQKTIKLTVVRPKNNPSNGKVVDFKKGEIND